MQWEFSQRSNLIWKDNQISNNIKMDMIRNNKNQTNQNKIWPGSVSKICPLKLTGTKNLMTINLLSAANLSPIPYHKFDSGGQSKHFGFWLLQQYLNILITYKKIIHLFYLLSHTLSLRLNDLLNCMMRRRSINSPILGN